MTNSFARRTVIISALAATYPIILTEMVLVRTARAENILPCL